MAEGAVRMALAKIKSKKLCKEVESGELRDLSPEDLEKANEVKEAALEILQDALDKELYGHYQRAYSKSCRELKDPLTCFSLLTKEFLEQMIEKMKKVRFLKDPKPKKEGIIAYVYPDDETCTVHLCPIFWMLSDQLSKDSKPGSLIHEVSHFLGTEDAAYDLVCIEGEDVMGAFLGRVVAYKEDEDGYLIENTDRKPLKDCDPEKYNNNANNIEYEFEIIHSHKTPYSAEDQKYPCCGEKRINSVCAISNIEDYIRKAPQQE
ncbi:uncharacterized protein LOC134322036 [Trichomycterus rosablanca]|uniref:uncharacterized protein LOC134322036 n=1 Tax=Trichomycterus rosablanca TaxID=2290929 RepID=UPI002F3571FC